jgi:hypothetical protein
MDYFLFFVINLSTGNQVLSVSQEGLESLLKIGITLESRDTMT